MCPYRYASSFIVVKYGAYGKLSIQDKALPKFLLYGKYGTQSVVSLQMKYSTWLQLVLYLSLAHLFMCHIFHIERVAML